MSGDRASIFDEAADMDLSLFRPKSKTDAAAPPVEVVRAVSEAANFRSREAVPAQSPAPTGKRPARRFRTGRNVAFNAKVSQETFDAIYAVTDANTNNGWTLGVTLERAIAALQRELESET